MRRAGAPVACFTGVSVRPSDGTDMLPRLTALGSDVPGLPKGVQVAGLDSIDHVVLVMLENRSFDHMLGFLYPKSDNFEGLDGTESNLDADGNEARVFEITP